MADTDTDTDAANPRWRGINHLALVTPDMDATVRFYHGVLGMRLVATVMAGPMRHYFFETAPGNTVAFFEVKGAEKFTAPAGIPDRLRKAQFDHLSFNLADEQGLVDLQNRLKAAGCEVTDVVDHGFVRSIYFNDPRHRPRGLVVGGRRHRPPGRLRRRAAVQRPVTRGRSRRDQGRRQGGLDSPDHPRRRQLPPDQVNSARCQEAAGQPLSAAHGGVERRCGCVR